MLTIELPPLRDREGDVGRLIDHFLGSDWALDAEAREALVKYHWPGNIRQFINVLERARILADDDEIIIDNLPRDVVEARPADNSTSDVAVAAAPPGVRLQHLERAHVVRILRVSQGNKAEARPGPRDPSPQAVSNAGAIQH